MKLKEITRSDIQMQKSELQKLIDGEWYKVNDPEVASRKINSAVLCQEFNNIP